jgi:hypothetical protein
MFGAMFALGSIVAILLVLMEPLDRSSKIDKLGSRQAAVQRKIKAEQKKFRSMKKQLDRKEPKLTDEDKVIEICQDIQTISETGQSTIPGLYQINGDPSELELELVIGPSATIVSNESLIGEIQNLWNAKVAAEAKERERLKTERRLHHQKAVQTRRLAARLALHDRNRKKLLKRAWRGLCCSQCFGQHPSEICVADRLMIPLAPSSVLSPYVEELGVYGIWEGLNIQNVYTWDNEEPVRQIRRALAVDNLSDYSLREVHDLMKTGHIDPDFFAEMVDGRSRRRRGWVVPEKEPIRIKRAPKIATERRYR